MKKKILIVNATFYRDISSDILLSAEKTLKANGYVSETIEVPGSFEIPAVISGFSKKYIGFIALGCVIRGETTHYDYICNETARALMDLSLSGLAIGYGILTCENKGQAIARKNEKGKNAALACINMIEILNESK